MKKRSRLFLALGMILSTGLSVYRRFIGEVPEAFDITILIVALVLFCIGFYHNRVEKG
jgi:hypothetical protein